MTTHAQLYNSLPSINEAHHKFVDAPEMFAKLAPLLSQYENKYGICLVHRHCTLKEGEKMVSTGNISQPERDVERYPLRWLASGEPFEYTQEVTHPPPRDLLDAFQTIVGGVGVLGLFYVHDTYDCGKTVVERTEGRKNIVEVTSQTSTDDIVTAWIGVPCGISPVMSCTPTTHA